MNVNNDPSIADRALLRRRHNDTALALPAFGIVLLVSPILNIFAQIDTFFGIPAAYLYIFAAWALMIAAAYRVTKGVTGDDTD